MVKIQRVAKSVGVAGYGQWMVYGSLLTQFGNCHLYIYSPFFVIAIISMANVEGGVTEDLSDFIPNVCTNSPEHGLAFCREHSEIISGLGYPVELRPFLKSCANNDEIDPDNFTKEMQKRVDMTLKEIALKIPSSNKFKSCADAQGYKTHSNYWMDKHKL